MFRARQHVNQLFSSLRTEGSFVQNLAVTFSGNVIAQALGFCATPFIARIYGPEAYGIFALFLAICNSIAPIATMQYPAGYVSARSDNEFYRLLQLTFIFLFGTTLVLSVALGVFKSMLPFELEGFIFLIPVYFFLMGLDMTLLGWNIRLKEFKRGAVAKTVSVSLSKGTTILLGVISKASALGMIIGNLLAYPFESGIKLSAGMKAGATEIFKSHPAKDVLATFKHFRAYPKYVTTGLILSNFSSQLPVYYFSLVFSQSLVGLFALANGIIVVPLSIIITSSTTVLLQKAAEVNQNEPHLLGDLAGKLYTRLFLISFFPLLLFAFISDWLFVLIFGAAWEQAGTYSAFLAIGAMLSVPAQPLSVFFRIMHKERINFIINIVFVILKFAALWWGAANNNIILSIVGYSLALVLAYMTQLFFIFKVVDHPRRSLVRDTLLVLAAFALVLYVKTNFVIK